MNKISYGILGLVIGMVIGFYLANSLNKPGSTSLTNGAIAKTEPQVRNEVVKDQSNAAPMMPEITETLDKAKNEPGNFQSQLSAGDLYLKIQNFPKALEFFEAANKIKPDDYDTVVKIGNTNFDSMNFEKAAEWYEKALQKKPDDYGVRTDYGVTFAERQNADISRSIKEFETSFNINPKHEPTIYNLGAAYYKTGEIDKAKSMSQKLEAINPASQLNKQLKKLLE